MAKNVKFSVVIALAPERNAEVLKSLSSVNYDRKNYEVIVEKGRNPSNNRNRGAEKSSGEIIAFIDDDALLHPEIFNVAEKFFREHPEIGIVGGPQLTPKDDSGFGKISGLALSSKFGAWKISNRYAGKKTIIHADETMLTSANLFCRKEVMDSIKFNPLLFPGEDPDFINRAKNAGIGIAYLPEMIVYHRRRDSLTGLIKQIYNYGSVRPLKESIIATLRMPFFIVPSVFVVYLLFLISFIFSSATIMGNVIGYGGTASIIIFAPLAVYLIVNIIFSLANSLKARSIKTLLLLPLVYLTIHLSYGAGFLVSSIGNVFSNRI